MKAWQKFNRRLSELGLLQKWDNQGGFGRIGIATPERIILFVHESRGDDYNEYHYLPFEELSKSKDFRMRALANFEEDENQEFVGKLYQWAKLGRGKCPLMADDVYFIANPTKTVLFQDDLDQTGMR